MKTIRFEEATITEVKCDYCKKKPWHKTDSKGKAICTDCLKKQYSIQPIKKVINLPKRNSPCPCGSGKKYKKCCYLKQFQQLSVDGTTVSQPK